MNQYDFNDCLAQSNREHNETSPELIRKLMGDSCIRVDRANTKQDKSGTDWIAVLRRGRKVNIDHKTRLPGCSKFWKGEPDLSLETWSVMPGSVPGRPHQRQTGWTLDESKTTDYTLHTFPLNDSPAVYLLPFELLRMAFRSNLEQWKQRYPVMKQRNVDRQTRRQLYVSQCVFVPASVAITAIEREMTHRIGKRKLAMVDMSLFAKGGAA